MKNFLHAHTNNKHSIFLGVFLVFPYGRRFRFRYYSPLLNLLYRHTHTFSRVYQAIELFPDSTRT
jgi:hypothetical protein